MSADHWAQCPRCHQRRVKEVEEQHKLVDAAYGQVPLAEFEAMRDAAMRMSEALEDQKDHTFREDWRITGAEEGVVHVRYRGGCTKCRLTLEFDTDHEIPGVDQ